MENNLELQGGLFSGFVLRTRVEGPGFAGERAACGGSWVGLAWVAVLASFSCCIVLFLIQMFEMKQVFHVHRTIPHSFVLNRSNDIMECPKRGQNP